MQYHWLNRQNNDKLIIFFAGWSFDHKPFEFLACENFDVLSVYDYSIIDEFISLKDYKEKYLIAWSMGVFTAYEFRNKLPEFDKKIAINGTPYPVDDEYGIPIKPFLLTLKHAKIGLEGKFYQNLFETQEEYDRYIQNPVERTIDNRAEELKNLYNRIKNTSKDYESYYDLAIISSNDKIIPTKNQINFWKSKTKIIKSGHFPYYNYKSWTELLCK